MKYLVVVDMQKDFVDGSLGSPAAQKIVDNVCRLIAGYKTGGVIYATMDTHFKNYLETSEGKQLPVKHCIKGSEGWELDKRVSAALDGKAQIFEKLTFGSIDLAKTLADKLDVNDTVELCGLCTDICVVSNALLIKAYCPENEIIVRSSCCAGVSEESHRAALATMRSCQINVIE
ncbi:MAG: cysteine hydrolase [Ruminococcus sp.]|nr:cysteine hydrolase [Ruminococcus sp.]